MSTQEELDRKWLERIISGEGMTPEIEALARRYDETPSVVNEETREAWGLCTEEAWDQATRLTALYNVHVLIVDGQPYNTPSEMFADVDLGILQISRDNANHPLMSLDATLALRVWHDLTHYELRSNFEFSGESLTYARQVEHVRQFSSRPLDILAHVLYCDIVAQVANGMLHKAFPVQKVFTRNQWGQA